MTTADSARRARILLVEDDHEAAYFAVHVLTTRGHFDVTHTMDPRVALDRARSERWDLVLTDLDLPGMTGLDLLAALRRSVPALPVVVITAHTALGPGGRRLPAQAGARRRTGRGGHGPDRKKATGKNVKFRFCATRSVLTDPFPHSPAAAICWYVAVPW